VYSIGEMMTETEVLGEKRIGVNSSTTDLAYTGSVLNVRLHGEWLARNGVIWFKG
jgi:hypothetical protein